MECAMCGETIDSRSELDGVVTHVLLEGEPRPIHGRCTGQTQFGLARVAYGD